MNEFIESLGNTIKDRILSPLAGSFMISWVLWNYKVIFVLFSDVKPWVKFGYISDQIWDDPLKTVLLVVVAPLLSSAFYIYVYPPIARYVLEYVGNDNKKTLLLKQKINDEKPASQEDFKKYKESHDRQLAKLEQQNKQLSNLVAEYRAAQQSIEDAVKTHKDESGSLAQALQESRGKLELKEQELLSASSRLEILSSEVRQLQLTVTESDIRRKDAEIEVNKVLSNMASLKEGESRLGEVASYMLGYLFPKISVEARALSIDALEKLMSEREEAKFGSNNS